jgi:hypothetical protein
MLRSAVALMQIPITYVLLFAEGSLRAFAMHTSMVILLMCFESASERRGADGIDARA